VPIGEGAGVNLGAASGRITIDLSDLNNVRAVSQNVGAEVERNLGRMGAGAAKAQSGFSMLSGAVRQWAGAFGIAFGAAGLAQMARFTVGAVETAVAFERQSVAAVNLAGSTAKLESLMIAYDKATGGAIDRATALADVTRLQAVGFGDTAAELQRFVTAARGISVATGQQQDYVISQLQLAIANQSTLRLDQLGLGVAEVKTRIDELKASDKSLTTEMAYQNAILGLAEDKFGALVKSSAAQATGMEKLGRAWKEYRLQVGQTARTPIDLVGEGLAKQLDELRDGLQQVTRDARRAGVAIDSINGPLGSVIRNFVKMISADPIGDFLRTHEWTGDLTGGGGPTPFFQRRPNPATIGARSSVGWESRERISGVGAAAGPRWGENQAAVEGMLVDHSAKVRQIETDATQARLDATRQYEEQRSTTIRDYEKSIARDTEDYTRARARAEIEFSRSIADVREEANRREAEQVDALARSIGRQRADAEERIADARIEANDRLIEIDRDYQRDRERALESHRDTLSSAAARLDAVAIFEEQRRFSRESRDAEEAHEEQRSDLQKQLDKRIEDEQKSLAKSIAQQQEAHNFQLEQSRAADERRIEDMHEQFGRQKELEDEDRRLRLERMAADHQDQLDEMGRQHALDMAQIEIDAAESRTQEQEQHEKALAALGVSTEKWIAENKRVTDAAIREFDRWFKTINDAFAEENAALGPPTDPHRTSLTDRPTWGTSPVITSDVEELLKFLRGRSFATGGWVDKTGLAMVHAGEYVLDRATAAAAATSRVVTFTGDVMVNIAGSTNMGADELYRVARAALTDVLTEVANGAS
jgi:hypothetical protein